MKLNSLWPNGTALKMINETEMAPNARGHKIFRQWWIPEEQPRAVVMVIHGIHKLRSA
jgi:hypothetical protein